MSINLSTSEGIIAEDLISSHIDFYPNSEGSGSGTNSFKTVAARSSGQSNSESKLGESVDRIIWVNHNTNTGNDFRLERILESQKEQNIRMLQSMEKNTQNIL